MLARHGTTNYAAVRTDLIATLYKKSYRDKFFGEKRLNFAVSRVFTMLAKLMRGLTCGFRQAQRDGGGGSQFRLFGLRHGLFTTTN